MVVYSDKVDRNPRLPIGSRGHSGVTLIEILVVSIIVAILSAVAIPMYSGYITNQRKLTAKAFAQTAAITAGAYLRRTGAPPTTVQLNARILNPNAGQFVVVVSETGPPYYVVVTEKSNPSKLVSDSAKF